MSFRSVVARWKQPENPIPSWVFQRYSTRLAFSDDDKELYKAAKDSVAVFVPKLQEMIRKQMGERYSVSASESKGQIYYHFGPRHPVDSFTLYVAFRGGKIQLVFSYMPYKANGSPDFSGLLEVKDVALDPDTAGLTLMRMARKLLPRIGK